jgi:hypothetical protein
MNRDMELAQELLEAKGDVKLQGKDGGVALRVAVNGDMELAKQLQGAKTDGGQGARQG